MNPDIYIYLFAITVFVVRTLIFLIGADLEGRYHPLKKNKNEHPFVSVIIPARNEENNIEKCIESVVASSYPLDRYEIIVINDRSTDATPTILEKLTSKYNNLRVIHTNDTDGSINLQGKTLPLQKGFDNAQGTILLMTDADCLVHEDWIKTIVDTFISTGATLVTSFTQISNHKLFEIFQAVEWIYMQTMARSGLGLGLPLGCYGNNLSLSKSFVDEIGGYRNVPFSLTEDLAMLQEVTSRGKKAIYLLEPSACVVTRPCKSFKELAKQHHRWALGGLKLGWKAAMFILTTICQWVGIIASLIFFDPIWLIIIIVFRIISDFFLITPSLIKLNKKDLIKFIFPSVFYFIFIEAIVPFMLLRRKVDWKDRSFKLKEINNKPIESKPQLMPD